MNIKLVTRHLILDGSADDGGGRAFFAVGARRALARPHDAARGTPIALDATATLVRVTEVIERVGELQAHLNGGIRGLDAAVVWREIEERCNLADAFTRVPAVAIDTERRSAYVSTNYPASLNDRRWLIERTQGETKLVVQIDEVFAPAEAVYVAEQLLHHAKGLRR